jgi:nucleotide-binding universal stress UspA family protein
MPPKTNDALDFRTILVPYDFSEASSIALQRGAGIAAASGGALHLLHVRQPGDDAHSLEKLAAQHGAVAHVRDDGPAHAICSVAVELGADLIVMATHRDEGFARALVSSVVVRTIRHAPCAVLIVPGAAVETEGRARAG